jgi:hypothetical protein
VVFFYVNLALIEEKPKNTNHSGICCFIASLYTGRDLMLEMSSLLKLVLFCSDFSLAQIFKANFGNSPQPFSIDVDPGFIEQTRLKASLTRFTTDVIQPDFTDGPPIENITAIRNHWTNTYDWAAVQDTINDHLKQFTTTVYVTGNQTNFSHPIQLHFVHHRSPREDAIPLLFIHGWPGSFLEVDRIIDGLTNPSNISATAFHVVAPSLPGFGFSPAPRFPGIGLKESGLAFNELMHQLGYDKYFIQGGGLGSHTLRYMAVDNPQTVRAIHTNLSNRQ